MNEYYNTLNESLMAAQATLRARVNDWASHQTSALSAAHARADFEDAILDAVRGETEWQYQTNNDLCAALGHQTLVQAVTLVPTSPPV